jgi:hypothetical protein
MGRCRRAVRVRRNTGRNFTVRQCTIRMAMKRLTGADKSR